MIGRRCDDLNTVRDLTELSYDQALGTEIIEIGSQMCGPIRRRYMCAGIGVVTNFDARMINDRRQENDPRMGASIGKPYRMRATGRREGLRIF